MGYVGYFYVESKSFDLRSGVGNGIVKLTECGNGQMRSVVMDFPRLAWLLKMMEELVSGTLEKESCRTHRVGDSVIILQRSQNRYG
jgi:hypothetical protein